MSAVERRRLIDQAVDEEILFRQAKAMHLDEGDSIVRRRLVQKAEFLIDDVQPVGEPTTSELEDYLAAHAEAYRTPLLVGFRHLFFARDKRGVSAETDARVASDRLTSDADAHVVSDAFFGGDSFPDRSVRDVLLGHGAGQAIAALRPGVWSSPVEGSYGFHVVRVEARREPAVSLLAEVRSQVRQALIDGRRNENRLAAQRPYMSPQPFSRFFVDRYALQRLLAATSRIQEPPGHPQRRAAPGRTADQQRHCDAS